MLLGGGGSLTGRSSYGRYRDERTEVARREVAVEVRDDDGSVLVVKVSFLRNVQ